MKITYEKLFKLMKERGIKKYDLRKSGIHPCVVDSLIHDRNVTIVTIARLCELLNCQPGDIMSCVEE